MIYTQSCHSTVKPLHLYGTNTDDADFCSHRTRSHTEVRVGMHSPPADQCHTHCHACYFRSRYHHWLWVLLYELISTLSASIHECKMTVCVIFVWLINSSDISCSRLVYCGTFIPSFCWESETDSETDTSIMCVLYLFLMSRFFVEYEFPSRSHTEQTLSLGIWQISNTARRPRWQAICK